MCNSVFILQSIEVEPTTTIAEELQYHTTCLHCHMIADPQINLESSLYHYIVFDLWWRHGSLLFNPVGPMVHRISISSLTFSQYLKRGRPLRLCPPITAVMMNFSKLSSPLNAWPTYLNSIWEICPSKVHSVWSFLTSKRLFSYHTRIQA